MRLLSASCALTQALVATRLVPLVVTRGTLDLRMLGKAPLGACRRADTGRGAIIPKGSANTKALWHKRLTRPSPFCFNVTKSQFLPSEPPQESTFAKHPLTYALIYQQPGT